MPVNQRILKAVSRDRSQVKRFGRSPSIRPARRLKRPGFYPGQRFDMALRKDRFR